MKKKYFIEVEFLNFCKTLTAEQKGKWGKMNAQQMVEHFSDSVRMGNGKAVFPLQTPLDKIPVMQNFVKSEKEFRENTPNNLIPDNPPVPKNPTMESAIMELENEIQDFFSIFTLQPDKIIQNPFFGDLDFSMWIQLLSKHALHHAKQFGYNPEFKFSYA
jgi:hypothetical protein